MTDIIWYIFIYNSNIDNILSSKSYLHRDPLLEWTLTLWEARPYMRNKYKCLAFLTLYTPITCTYLSDIIEILHNVNVSKHVHNTWTCLLVKANNNITIAHILHVTVCSAHWDWGYHSQWLASSSSLGAGMDCPLTFYELYSLENESECSTCLIADARNHCQGILIGHAHSPTLSWLTRASSCSLFILSRTSALIRCLVTRHISSKFWWVEATSSRYFCCRASTRFSYWRASETYTHCLIPPSPWQWVTRTCHVQAWLERCI